MFALATAIPAAAKDVTPPSVPMPDGYEAHAPLQVLPGWELDRFWKLFGDPTLDALEDEAFRISPDIRTAAQRLVEANATRAGQIAATGKTLKAIYITHAHGDHFFGLKILQDRFPGVRAFATPEVVARMKLQITPEKLNGRWRKLFPDQIPDVISIAEPLQGDEIDLEGRKLAVVRLGHTDTDDTTCLHVPSIGLVVAGEG